MNVLKWSNKWGRSDAGGRGESTALDYGALRGMLKSPF